LADRYLPRLIEDIERQPREDRLPHVLILDEMDRTDLSSPAPL
jgi:5-methylcytosine-specific restriction protein B